MSLKLVKNSGGGSDVIVMMDGKLYNNGGASIKMMDTKTMHIDLFIPSGDHTLQIKGLEAQLNYMETRQANNPQTVA